MSEAMAEAKAVRQATVVAQVVFSATRYGQKVAEARHLRAKLADCVADEDVEECFGAVVSTLAFAHGIIVR